MSSLIHNRDNRIAVEDGGGLLTLSDVGHFLKHKSYPISYLMQSQLNKSSEDEEHVAKALKLANLVNALTLSLLGLEQRVTLNSFQSTVI